MGDDMEKLVIGNQYELDDPFKKKARYHQSQFRAKVLGLDRYDEYGNRLTEKDAKRGLNFYQGFNIIDEVHRRFSEYNEGLYADMLRSEHIPFNFFIPFKENLTLAKSVLNEFLNDVIVCIDEIKIEYSPEPKEEYLNDKTAFDVYVEYTHTDRTAGIIGIEVKYSEKEYPLKKGSKEDRFVNNPDSPYNRITKIINLYKPENIAELPNDRYRQAWRNQLLGESILLKQNSKFKHFTSVILFPAGNTHFVEVVNEYLDFIQSPVKETKFIGISYEVLFDKIENAIKRENSDEFSEWIQYLRQRYLFNTGL